MHTIDKKPELDIQLRYAMESFEDKIGSPATFVRCHPTEAEKFAKCGLRVVPDLISVMAYWLGKE
jgi:hypothetical protein